MCRGPSRLGDCATASFAWRTMLSADCIETTWLERGMLTAAKAFGWPQTRAKESRPTVAFATPTGSLAKEQIPFRSLGNIGSALRWRGGELA